MLALIGALIFYVPFCQALSSAQQSKIDSFVEDLMKCRPTVPGLSLAIVHNGTEFTKGYGWADVEEQLPVQANTTTFPIGSLSKAFTSALLAQLLLENEEKDYSWDTPIVDILGKGFKLYNDLLTKETNLRDLLAHKTGIPSYFEPLVGGYDPVLTRKEAVRRLRFLPPTKPFRTQYMYNNHMYMLAGHVAERLTGQPWETLVKERFFSRLGMNTAGFVTDNDRSNIPNSYVTVNGILEKVDKDLLLAVDPLGPAGSVTASASDMTNWMNYHLGVYKSLAITPPKNVSLLRETHLPCMLIPPDHPIFLPLGYPVSDYVYGYGLAWMTNIYRDVTRVSHTSSIGPMYMSIVWLYPEHDLGIFTSTNGPVGDKADMLLKYAIHYFASDVILGKEPWLNASTACHMNPPKTPPDPKQESVTTAVPSRPLSDYAGVFGHLAFGNITVYENKTTNELVMHQGRFLQGVLRFSGTDSFKLQPFGKLGFWNKADQMNLNQKIIFSQNRKSSAINKLIVPMEDAMVPFIRDLKLTDVPKDAYPNCEVVVSASGKLSRNITFLATVVLIICTFVI